MFGEYRPNQVVAYNRADADSAIPLLEGRVRIDAKATAYVFQNFACQMPVTERQRFKHNWITEGELLKVLPTDR